MTQSLWSHALESDLWYVSVGTPCVCVLPKKFLKGFFWNHDFCWISQGLGVAAAGEPRLLCGGPALHRYRPSDVAPRRIARETRCHINSMIPTVSLRAGPASAWVKALDDLLEVQSLQSVKFARCILYKFLFEDASRKCRVNKWNTVRVKVKVFDSLLLLGRLLVKTGSLFRAMGPWQMQQVYDMCEASSTMCIRWDLGDRYRSLRMRRSHEIWWFQRTFLYVFARRWARHVQTCRWHSKSWMRNVTSSDVRVFLHHSGEQQNFIELQWVILPWFAEYSCSTFLHRRLAGLWEDAARFEGCSVGLTSWFMNLEELITSRQHIRRACLAWHTPEQSTPTEGSLLRTWAHCDLRLDREGCIARRRTGESGCAIQGVNWRESPEWQAFHAWMNWKLNEQYYEHHEDQNSRILECLVGPVEVDQQNEWLP